LIVIHVCDENRKINRDFSCQKTLLLEEMKYFRTYLTVTSAFDDIDISVHCDVHIFEWLVKYIHQPQKPPSLDSRSVVSILISADFLEMERLVKQCLAFMRGHINEIVKMPIDLNCMNDKLLSQLTALFNDEDLEAVRDKKDKLCSKMYMKKLQDLLDDEASKLQCCCHCGKLYTAELKGRGVFCRKAKMFVDFHGEMVATCQPSRGWNVNEYVKQLRAGDKSWREIYWKIWGSTQVLMSTEVLCVCSHSQHFFSYPYCTHPVLILCTSSPPYCTHPVLILCTSSPPYCTHPVLIYCAPLHPSSTIHHHPHLTLQPSSSTPHPTTTLLLPLPTTTLSLSHSLLPGSLLPLQRVQPPQLPLGAGYLPALAEPRAPYVLRG
jgi:hypothetical protein